jgi:hypothetical protein
MYDSEALYIGGVVRDPTPLMNRHDPKVNGDGAWNADALQVRLCLNPKAGYPIHESTAPDPKPNDQLVHMLLWYYTDRQEASLQLAYGMTFSPPKAKYPKGVVPHDKFQAAYRMAPDKKGYTFEYRIPWATLEANAPLKAGDLVAATLQTHWGTADGLSLNAGVSGCAYDLLAGPGFGFLDTSCWGRAIFAEKGNIPKELVQEGIPIDPPLPLTFNYDLPADGDVTVALVNDKGQMVRHFLAQAPRKKGQVVERWDGLDDAGKPLPAGQYAWKGLYHRPITTRYLLGVHNSGHPSYATADGTGAWGADWGRPTTVCAVGDYMLLAWRDGEAGWSILRTDLEGRRQWGIKPGATHLASDGERVFSTGGAGFHLSKGVECFSVVEGRPLNFGNGKPHADFPPGGDDTSNSVSGLAYGSGVLYEALDKRNLIALLDPRQGTVKATWDVPEPRRMAVSSDAALLVISKGSVLSVKDGKIVPFLTEHLDEPAGIAVDPGGTVCVANRGKLQNVSVFDKHGKYLHSIGKEGGRPPVGLFDKSGMLEPGGIAIDKTGKLWVAETLDYPKLFSVWEAKSGRLANELYGGSHYSTSVCMDPKHEDEVYCHMTIWKVDLSKGTWYPHSTMWRQTGPNVAADSYSLHRVFTAKNGKQFAYGTANYAGILFMRDADRFKPIISGINNLKGNQWVSWPTYPIFADQAKYPNGSYYWQDANDDQILQPGEIVNVPSTGDDRPHEFQVVTP